MPERHLRVLRRRRHGAVAAVEPLQAGALEVVPVGGVAVPDELPGELDLVGGVVHMEPRRRAVPKADLEQRRGHGDEQDHRDARSDEHPRAPGLRAPAGHGDRGDEHAGENGRGADDAEIPAAVGGADEGAEQAVPRDRRRSEGPRVGAEPGHVQRHERPQHPEDAEPGPPVDPRSAHAGVSAFGPALAMRKLEAIPSTSQVTGSSKKPL